MDIKHYKNGQLALLGLNNDLGIHIYSRKGEFLSSFAEPFPIPSRMSQYKDAPFSKFPMKFNSDGNGKIFLLNPHKYEINIFKDGQSSGKIKGKSDFFRPLTIGASGNSEKKALGIIFPTASVLEYGKQIFITLQGLLLLGKEEIDNQMQVYENQKLLCSMDVKEFPYAVDSSGRLYFSALEDGFAVVRRYHVLLK